jgi:hypothetical protein
LKSWRVFGYKIPPFEQGIHIYSWLELGEGIYFDSAPTIRAAAATILRKAMEKLFLLLKLLFRYTFFCSLHSSSSGSSLSGEATNNETSIMLHELLTMM